MNSFFHVELLPDFMVLVLYLYKNQVEAGLNAFPRKVLQVPGWKGSIGFRAKAGTEGTAWRKNRDGGFGGKAPEGEAGVPSDGVGEKAPVGKGLRRGIKSDGMRTERSCIPGPSQRKRLTMRRNR
jgi:hypothetical protein